jgi:hypothetical protein
MERLAIAFLGMTLAACKGDKDESNGPSDDSHSTTPDDSPTNTGDGCEAPGSSKCDNPGSIIRGYVARDPDSIVTGWSGNLWVFLTHYWPSQGELGGEVKASVEYKGVDLEDGKPFPFEIDMCDGSPVGSMWSEDACEYNLSIILDKNGNVTPNNILPDENEPAHKVENLYISCEDDSQCLGTILLDCRRGSGCFTFDSTKMELCDCAEQTCNSYRRNCD